MMQARSLESFMAIRVRQQPGQANKPHFPEWNMFRLPSAFVIGLLVLCVSRAWAWSNKEHIQLTRIAAEQLIDAPDTPPEMKQWLISITPDRLDMAGEKKYLLEARVGMIPRNIDGVAYWATVPDMAVFTDREKKVEPYGVSERFLHYTDVELFQADPARQIYKHDLSTKPRKEDLPRKMDDPRYQKAGMLPFRVEESYGHLVKALRDGRLNDEPGKFPRDDHAAKWAGYLAHYLEDNTQPHHATVDYKSRTYFADPLTSPNIHWDIEGRLVDDEFDDYPQLREKFWNAFIKALEARLDPVESNDPWEGTLDVLLTSYDALPLMGQAAMAGYGQGGTPESPRGPIGPFDAEKFFHFKGTYRGVEMTLLEMKAHQMAWSVKRVQRMWRKAWDEAHSDKIEMGK
jgi:hypothetical protein